MRFNAITYPETANGVGLRVCLWVSGCSHHCPGCHNPQTWSFESGRIFDETTQNTLFDLVSNPDIKGLTITGGDPLDSYHDVVRLLKAFRKRFGSTKDIWLYTGYTYPQVDAKFYEIYQYVDYLVEGPYIRDQRDTSLSFRGSRNQSIIDCKNMEVVDF